MMCFVDICQLVYDIRKNTPIRIYGYIQVINMKNYKGFNDILQLCRCIGDGPFPNLIKKIQL